MPPIPPSWYLKLAGGGLTLALLLGGALWISNLQDKASRGEQAVAALALERANAGLALRLSVRNAEKARERGEKVTALQGEVRNAKRPVPQNCRAVLDPIVRAMDGLRDIERGGPARPAAVLPRLQADATGTAGS